MSRALWFMWFIALGFFAYFLFIATLPGCGTASRESAQTAPPLQCCHYDPPGKCNGWDVVCNPWPPAVCCVGTDPICHFRSSVGHCPV